MAFSHSAVMRAWVLTDSQEKFHSTGVLGDGGLSGVYLDNEQGHRHGSRITVWSLFFFRSNNEERGRE